MEIVIWGIICYLFGVFMTIVIITNYKNKNKWK